MGIKTQFAGIYQEAVDNFHCLTSGKLLFVRQWKPGVNNSYFFGDPLGRIVGVPLDLKVLVLSLLAGNGQNTTKQNDKILNHNPEEVLLGVDLAGTPQPLSDRCNVIFSIERCLCQ